MIEIALLSALAVTVLVVVALAFALKRSGRRIESLEARARDAEEAILGVRRLQEEIRFLEQFLRDVPTLARHLNDQIQVRDIPVVLLDFLVRTFQPEQALVLVRGKPKLSEPERDQILIVAAAHPPDGAISTGTQLSINSSLLREISASQRVLTRSDLTAVVEGAGDDPFRSFPIDLATPIVLGSRTLGVIALSRTRRYQRLASEVLGVVAQMGASTWSSLVAYRQIKSAADIDPLTGIANKRVLNFKLGDSIYDAEQEGVPVSAFIFDLDNFKNYNDVNGHLAGDQLLQTLARLVQGFIRMDDIFGRFGGEEFLIILPGRTPEQALLVAEKIRGEIEAYDFPFGANQPLGRVTVSGGVAGYPAHAAGASSLLRAADAALYRAKEAGRNRILLASD